MLDEALEVYLSAYEREPFTSASIDLSRGRIRRVYSRLVRTRYALWLLAGHPLFSAVDDGRVVGFAALASPNVAIPRGRWLRSWLSFLVRSFPSWLAMLPRVIRSAGLLAAMRPPNNLPAAHYTLDAIAVHPSHQGKGVGRLLLEEVEKCCLADKSSSGVYLYTGEEKNRRIYERFGYRLLDKRKAGGITAYHMFRTNAKDSAPTAHAMKKQESVEWTRR